MRHVLAFASLLVLAACATPEDKACDAAIKATLKAPASYKRVSEKGGVIEYDAVNSYNAPIRHRGLCMYHPDTGKADFVALTDR